jgi:putative transposase
MPASAVLKERSIPMPASKFTEEQIIYAVRQAEFGTPVSDLSRQVGVSGATFYAWGKRHGHASLSELRQLRQLEEEASRLKRLVADFSLDKHMVSEALRMSSEVCLLSRTRQWFHGTFSVSFARPAARYISVPA